MVTAIETGKLLALAATVDNRVVDELTIAGWFEVLKPYGYEECRDALVRHRRESLDYLEPAHVIANVKRARAAAHDEAQRREARAARSNGAPMPKNFAALSDAYRSKDPVAIAREKAAYDEQLVEAGFPVLPLEDGRPFSSTLGHGQGKDFAIPRGDR